MRTSEKSKNNFLISEITSILPVLTNHLMINGSMVFFSGLLHGKLGISLFFFQYSRHTGNPLYNKYARYLVDLVISQIHEDYPLDYERGLSGVGTGFNYLKKHGYFDVGDDFMSNIDSKIRKAIRHERRISLLTGFGRYLLSRFDFNSTMKDSLIQLVDLFVNQSNSTTSNNMTDILSFFCDLYLLDIEKENIKPYFSILKDILIRDVQRTPMSWSLFTLIKLSFILPSCSLCQKTAHDALSTIFAQKRVQFEGINDLLWLLQCENLLKGKYQAFIPEIKNKIAQNIASFNLTYLDKLFASNHVFALHGGYAGLGLALISILNTDNVSWINLLKYDKSVYC